MAGIPRSPHILEGGHPRSPRQHLLHQDANVSSSAVLQRAYFTGDALDHDDLQRSKWPGTLGVAKLKPMGPVPPATTMVAKRPIRLRNAVSVQLPKITTKDTKTAAAEASKPELLQVLEKLLNEGDPLKSTKDDDGEKWEQRVRNCCSALRLLSKHFRTYSGIFTTIEEVVKEFLEEHSERRNALSEALEDIEQLHVQLNAAEAALKKAEKPPVIVDVPVDAKADGGKEEDEVARARIRLLLDEIDRLRASHERDLQHVTAKFQGELSAIHSRADEFKRLYSELKIYRDDLEDKVASLEQQLNAKAKEMAGMVSHMTEKNEHTSALEAQLAHKEKELTAAKEKATQAEAGAARLVNQVQTMARDIKELEMTKKRQQELLTKLQEVPEAMTPRPDLSWMAEYIVLPKSDMPSSTAGKAEVLRAATDRCARKIAELERRMDAVTPPSMVATTQSTRDIIALGTSDAVPPWLRWHGKVQNLNLPKRRAEQFIKSFWVFQKKRRSERDGHRGSIWEEKIQEIYHAWLRETTKDETGAIELAYALHQGMLRWREDADFELLADVLDGRLSELVHDDQMQLIESFREWLVGLDMASGAKTGKVHIAKVCNRLREFFTYCNDEELGQIRALVQELPLTDTDEILYEEIFKEDEDLNQTQLIEFIRDHHLFRAKDHLMSIRQLLTAFGESTTLNRIVDAVHELDPMQDVDKIRDYFAKCLGHYGEDVDPEMQVDVKCLSNVLTRGFLTRATPTASTLPMSPTTPQFVDIKPHSRFLPTFVSPASLELRANPTPDLPEELPSSVLSPPSESQAPGITKTASSPSPLKSARKSVVFENNAHSKSLRMPSPRKQSIADKQSAQAAKRRKSTTASLHGFGERRSTKHLVERNSLAPGSVKPATPEYAALSSRGSRGTSMASVPPDDITVSAPDETPRKESAEAPRHPTFPELSSFQFGHRDGSTEEPSE